MDDTRRPCGCNDCRAASEYTLPTCMKWICKGCALMFSWALESQEDSADKCFLCKEFCMDSDGTHQVVLCSTAHHQSFLKFLMKNLNTIRDEINKVWNDILMHGHQWSTHYLIDLGVSSSSAIAHDLELLKQFWDQCTDELDDPDEFNIPFSVCMNEVTEMLTHLNLLITDIATCATDTSAKSR